jgi:hypothetical protein
MKTTTSNSKRLGLDTHHKIIIGVIGTLILFSVIFLISGFSYHVDKFNNPSESDDTNDSDGSNCQCKNKNCGCNK